MKMNCLRPTCSPWVSYLNWIQRTANNRKVRASGPRGTSSGAGPSYTRFVAQAYTEFGLVSELGNVARGGGHRKCIGDMLMQLRVPVCTSMDPLHAIVAARGDCAAAGLRAVAAS